MATKSTVTLEGDYATVTSTKSVSVLDVPDLIALVLGPTSFTPTVAYCMALAAYADALRTKLANIPPPPPPVVIEKPLPGRSIVVFGDPATMDTAALMTKFNLTKLVNLDTTEGVVVDALDVLYITFDVTYMTTIMTQIIPTYTYDVALNGEGV